jgi:hypothetical protein
MGTSERSLLLALGTVLLVIGLFADLIVLSTVPPSELSWLVREGVFDDCTRVTNATSAHDCWTMTLIGLDSAHLYLALACLIIFGAVVQRTEVDRRANLRAVQSGACAHINCTAKVVLFGSGAGVVLAVVAFFYTLLSGAPMFVSSTRSDACTGSAANADPIDCWDAIKPHAIAVISVAFVLVVLVAAAEYLRWSESDRTVRIKGLLAAVVGCSCLPMLVGGARLLAERELLTGSGRLIAATVVAMSALMGIVFLHGVLDHRKQSANASAKAKEDASTKGEIAPLNASPSGAPTIAPTSKMIRERWGAWLQPVFGAVLWAVLLVLALLHAVAVSDHPHPRVSFINQTVLEACAQATPATTINCWQTIQAWKLAGMLLILCTALVLMADVWHAFCSIERPFDLNACSALAMVVGLLLFSTIVLFHGHDDSDVGFDGSNMTGLMRALFALGVLGLGALCCMLRYAETDFQAFALVDFATCVAIVGLLLGSVVIAVSSQASSNHGTSSYSEDVQNACAGNGASNTGTPATAPINCWRAARSEAIAVVVYAFVMLVLVYVRTCVNVALSNHARDIWWADVLLLESACAPALVIFLEVRLRIDQFDQTGTDVATGAAVAVFVLSLALFVCDCVKRF